MLNRRENKVGLFGTCNNSTWRNEIIPYLNMDSFNPIVEDWTPECQLNEEYQKKICNYLLYVITPKMTGTFSIAEVVHDSIIFGGEDRVIFCVLEKDGDDEFTVGQIKSLNAVKELIRPYGCNIFDSLTEVVNFLNSKKI